MTEYGFCNLCQPPRRIEAGVMMEHLRVVHDVAEGVATWPDGGPMIIDSTLAPEDFEPTLAETIATGSQAEVIRAYAAAIKSTPAGQLAHGLEWREVNDAIVARWSKAGLTKIKREAWRIVDRSLDE